MASVEGNRSSLSISLPEIPNDNSVGQNNSSQSESGNQVQGKDTLWNKMSGKLKIAMGCTIVGLIPLAIIGISHLCSSSPSSQNSSVSQQNTTQVQSNTTQSQNQEVDENAPQFLNMTPSSLTNEQKTEMLNTAKQSAYYQSLSDQPSDTYRTLSPRQNFERLANEILSNNLAVQTMQDNNMTLSEAVAIREYTGGDYNRLNGQIRENSKHGTPMDNDVTEFKRSFESGLSKLPSLPGGTVLYRGSKLPTDVANQHKINLNPITTTGVYSTTMSSDEAFPGVNHTIKITIGENSPGKDISMFSAKPHEQEVAFPPGTQFDITSRIVNGEQSDRNVNMHEDLGDFGLSMADSVELEMVSHVPNQQQTVTQNTVTQNTQTQVQNNQNDYEPSYSMTDSELLYGYTPPLPPDTN
ncbi:MAG: ADP-ribosyltransferase [Pseudomonadota bacterium]